MNCEEEKQGTVLTKATDPVRHNGIETEVAAVEEAELGYDNRDSEMPFISVLSLNHRRHGTKSQQFGF
jgi:hypothetical protein